MTDPDQSLRALEALLFAATEPLDEATLAARMPQGCDVRALLDELAGLYANRGVNLVRVAGRWSLRTAADLAPLLESYRQVTRRLSRAAVETLAIIAYHQPTTRAEIEDIRGVAISKGTLDLLFETGWIRPRGRRRTPGRPMQWGTTDDFLAHFGLDDLGDLPGVEELRASGLLDTPPLLRGVATAEAESDAAAEMAEDEDAQDEATPFDPPPIIGD